MLLTFTSKTYPDITIFGEVALQLIKMMRHSGVVPSAIMANDVPAAQNRLKTLSSQMQRAATGKAQRCPR